MKRCNINFISCLLVVGLLLTGITKNAVSEDKNDPTINATIPSAAILKEIAKRLKQKGLSTLPSSSSVIKSNTSSSTAHEEAVSGTPPLVSSFTAGSVKEIFWRPGVVDAIATGNPTQTQCGEFFAGMSDGQSGGIGACHVAEGVVDAFQTILDAETSSCYLKNFPTNKNKKSGAVTLNKGKFPNKDITQLFVPSSKARLVLVHAPPLDNGTPPQDGAVTNDTRPSEAIFTRISSTKENKAAGLFYKAELYFCPDGAPGPRGFDIVQVSNSGVYSITSGNTDIRFGGGSHSLTLNGFLNRSGKEKTDWDPTRSRTSDVDFNSSNDMSRTQFEITSDNLIYLKRKHARDNNGTRDYSIAHFSGTEIINALFLEAGYKGISNPSNQTERPFGGATEYRDTFYAAAPSNPYYKSAQDYDLSSDSFYDRIPPDIEITLNVNDTLKTALQPCFNKQLKNREFCNGDPLIKVALARFPTVCNPGGPPGGGGSPPH